MILNTSLNRWAQRWISTSGYHIFPVSRYVSLIFFSMDYLKTKRTVISTYIYIYIYYLSISLSIAWNIFCRSSLSSTIRYIYTNYVKIEREKNTIITHNSSGKIWIDCSSYVFTFYHKHQSFMRHVYCIFNTKSILLQNNIPFR